MVQELKERGSWILCGKDQTSVYARSTKTCLQPFALTHSFSGSVLTDYIRRRISKTQGIHIVRRCTWRESYSSRSLDSPEPENFIRWHRTYRTFHFLLGVCQAARKVIIQTYLGTLISNCLDKCALTCSMSSRLATERGFGIVGKP